MEFSSALIWAAMTGGLIVLCLVALVDLAMFRARAAWEVLVFFLACGAFALFMSGLFELLVPGLSPPLLLSLKAGLGPAVCALALAYLAKWLAAQGRDHLITVVIQAGSAGLAFASLVLAATPWLWLGTKAAFLLCIGAALDFVAVVLAALASARAAVLGDRLAWGMVGACGCVAVPVAGLHAHALQPAALGRGGHFLIALSATVFLLTVAWLVLQRNLQYRRLQRELRSLGGRGCARRLAFTTRWAFTTPPALWWWCRRSSSP